MSDTTPDRGIAPVEDESVGAQPLRDGDTSIDLEYDPAQAEWDRTTSLDAGVPAEELDAATATGDDPAQLPDPLDEVPADDLHAAADLPETQGLDPNQAELGEEGQGDLAPEDL
ncbi:sugar ABC transporter ATPase [Microbacterium sp. HJ5]